MTCVDSVDYCVMLCYDKAVMVLTNTGLPMGSDVRHRSASGRRSYGTRPLALTIPAAVAVMKEILKAGEPELSDSELAVKLGNSRTSSSFTRKAAALKAFSFLDEPEKGRFVVTNRGMSVGSPRSSHDSMHSQKLALLSVGPFRKMFDQHKGRLLPADEFLRNLIEQDCAIPKDFSSQWVADFKVAAGSVGLLHDRGEGKTQLGETPTAPENPAPVLATAEANRSPDVPMVELPPASNQALSDATVDTGHTTRIRLSDNRFALFMIPDELSVQDTKKLKSALKGLDAIIDSLTEQGQ